MRTGNGAIGADNGLYAKACGQGAVTLSVLRRRDEVGGRALVTARFIEMGSRWEEIPQHQEAPRPSKCAHRRRVRPFMLRSGFSANPAR